MVDPDGIEVYDICSPGAVISERSTVAACPVNIFRRYLSEVGKLPVEAGHYVFRTFYKSKLGHKLVSVNKPLNYSCTIEYFKSNIRSLIPDISLHLFSKKNF